MSPTIIYGTAWKEEATEKLVLQALKAGFRAIDTANQRKHYDEAAVGQAIVKSNIPRKELFIQTKYTYPPGQDKRLPYDMSAGYPTQVRQSFQSSLEHLQVKKIDSYLLHGPSNRFNFSETDWQVWQEMEALHTEGLVSHLGISNVNLEQLRTLCQKAKIKPTFVQNRCFAELAWDKKIREFCKKNKITYQGFSLLTANQYVPLYIKDITERVHKTPAQVIFKFALDIGILPLTGTTNLVHMKEDLELNFNLTKEEIEFIENFAK